MLVAGTCLPPLGVAVVSLKLSFKRAKEGPKATGFLIFQGKMEMTFIYGKLLIAQCGSDCHRFNTAQAEREASRACLALGSAAR